MARVNKEMANERYHGCADLDHGAPTPDSPERLYDNLDFMPVEAYLLLPRDRHHAGYVECVDHHGPEAGSLGCRRRKV